MRGRILSALGVVFAAVLLCLAPAEAATFTVNSTGDTADPSVGDGVCDVDGGTAGSQCTLRAAIQQANASDDSDSIEFALATGNTITPGSALPQIVFPVTIDGTTQPLDGRVDLDGVSAGSSANGLVLSGGSSTVKGMVIERFGLNGIQLFSHGGNTVTGNRIGTDQAGGTARGNGASGISASGDDTTISGNLVSANASGILISNAANVRVQDNTVGTTLSGTVALGNTPGRGIQLNSGTVDGVISGNVVSANGGDGVAIGSGATGNQIKGNLIGTDADGTADLGNATGVALIGGSSNTIGGTVAADRNVISGSSTFGIDIQGAQSGNVIEGNRIGTNSDGTAAIANAADGIRVTQGSGTAIGGSADGAGNLISGNGGSGVLQSGGTATIRGNKIGVNASGGALGNAQDGIRVGASDGQIGGTATGDGNRIAFNGHDGVNVVSGSHVAIRGNAIATNGTASGDVGIDLGADGTTPNDAVPDSDVGPNGLQNFPELTVADSSSAGTEIEGTLASAPTTTYRVELYESSSCDPSGNGEGDSFVGSTDVTTPAGGQAAFTFSTPTIVPVGHSITATATDAAGNTSEFSACRTVAAGLAPPSNLSASGGDGEVSLSWSAPAGATSFTIYRGTSAAGPQAQIGTSTTTTFTDTGLSNGTTYYYTVTASSAGGTSPHSDQVSATPQTPSPTGLSATGGDGEVSLSWSAPAGATSFTIYRSTSAAGPQAQIGTSTTTTFTDTGLSNGTTYYYTVTASSAGGTSPHSDQVSVTLQPSPPGGLSATGGNGEVSLSWSPVTGATAYTIYRSIDGVSFQPAGNSTATAFTDAPLNPGARYYYRVAASNSGGTSQQSSVVSAVVVLPAPSGLSAVGGDGVVSLSWSAVNGASDYTIYRSTSAAGPQAQIGTSTTTTFTDTGLSNGTTYYYTVTAVSPDTTSVPSEEASATPQAPGHVFPGAKIPHRPILIRHGKASIPINCPATTQDRCNGSLALTTVRTNRHGSAPRSQQAAKRASRLALGRTRFSIRPGKTKRVSVKLSKAGLKLLSRLGKLKVRVTAVTRDGSASVATTHAVVTLSAGKKARNRRG